MPVNGFLKADVTRFHEQSIPVIELTNFLSDFNNVFFENRECQGSLNENGNGSGRCSSADGCIAEWTATLIEGTIG